MDFLMNVRRDDTLSTKFHLGNMENTPEDMQFFDGIEVVTMKLS